VRGLLEGSTFIHQGKKTAYEDGAYERRARGLGRGPDWGQVFTLPLDGQKRTNRKRGRSRDVIRQKEGSEVAKQAVWESERALGEGMGSILASPVETRKRSLGNKKTGP